ncbi:MAG: hypothetical protein Q8N88_01230 [Nanoarchaeota archaeon]|nr:hypothetical protein [Nanoarchaeota archaeon]
MNWEECKLKNFVKESKVDVELVKSLLKESEKKLITDNFSPLNKDTCSTKITLNYDSLREVLEAVALKNGFKIYNHDCFTGFLKEVLKLDKESFEFNRFRLIRNSINYYGKSISLDNAQKILDDIKKLRNKLIKDLS